MQYFYIRLTRSFLCSGSSQ